MSEGEEQIEVERGSDKVFADLGLPESECLLEKAERMHALSLYLKRSKASTRRAAARLGASKQEILLLRRGAFNALSFERVGEIFARLPRAAQDEP